MTCGAASGWSDSAHGSPSSLPGAARSPVPAPWAGQDRKAELAGEKRTTCQPPSPQARAASECRFCVTNSLIASPGLIN